MNLPSWPYFAEDEILAVTSVLNSGNVNYWTGQEARLFEKEYADFVGTPYAVALMNGTVALEAALFALNIGPGDEVITTSRTFIASASSIVMRGAKPILVDVDLNSQNMTAQTIEAALSPHTKAILVVHLAGWPCDMDPILTLAKKHNLYVIEDCAQANGATYRGKQVGSLGDIGAFSFCQDKIISTGGEGGMITTHNKKLWETIWSYKDHGKSYEAVYHRDHAPGFRWVHESFGTNWRMTEMQAAIGRIQLRKLPEWLRIRSRNAGILNEVLAGCGALRLSYPPADIQHANYKYYVFLKFECLKRDWTRDRIMQSINDAGIPCFAGSCSEIYLEKAFINLGLQPSDRLPIAKILGDTSLMFLIHPTLTTNDMKRIAETIIAVLDQAMLSDEELLSHNAF